VTTADGTRLFVRDWGSGDPMLFMAGWCVPSDFWGYQMGALAERGVRCVAYDRRSHGRSSDPGSGYDFDTLADDLASVIDALDLRRVTLVGHSMAYGEIATFIARKQSDRVRNVVLVAPGAPFLMKTDDNPAGIDRALLEQMRRPLTQDFPGWLAENAPPFFTPTTSASMIEWAKNLMLQTSLHAAIACSRTMTQTDLRGALERMTLPTLVIHGDKDVSNPLAIAGRPTAALIKNSKLIVYEGAPHGLPLTHSERLNQDLLAFATS
jgi:pimeloyl-ACP methyl ester carboxylesterase